MNLNKAQQEEVRQLVIELAVAMAHDDETAQEECLNLLGALLDITEAEIEEADLQYLID